MNLIMFPKMLGSHEEGWAWLMKVHPSVPKMFLLYVAPMSLIPPAMLLYAGQAYSDTMLGNASMTQIWRLAALFYLAEIVMVPLMAAVIQQIGDVVDARPEYHDAFAFAAVVPTPLWLSALGLFLPSLALNAMIVGVALFAAGMLIYEGAYSVFQVKDEGQSLLLTGSVLAAGLVAWVALMGLAFVSWGSIIA